MTVYLLSEVTTEAKLSCTSKCRLVMQTQISEIEINKKNAQMWISVKWRHSSLESSTGNRFTIKFKMAKKQTKSLLRVPWFEHPCRKQPELRIPRRESRYKCKPTSRISTLTTCCSSLSLNFSIEFLACLPRRVPLRPLCVHVCVGVVRQRGGGALKNSCVLRLRNTLRGFP